MRAIKNQARIIGALLMRELVTRYGREGLGFLWLVLEPLIFCFGVMGMWALIKPEYEHGVRIAPFVMTGYMGLLLFRHMVSASMGAVQANIGLLHHRRVRPIHIYMTRAILETAGGALAFMVVYVTLLILGVVELPSNYLTLYSGFLLMAWVGMGFGITLASLAIRFEVLDRIVSVLMYLMIPLSGAFIMVDWVPYAYRDIYLLIPLPHTIEMMRAAVFGEFIPTHYNPYYPLYFGAVLNAVGLLVLSDSQKFIEVD